MSTDIKLSNAQLSKIIKSGEFLSALLDILAGLLMKVSVLLAKNLLGPLETISILVSNRCRYSKKNAWSWSCKCWKRTHLVISNEEMDDIIRIIISLENSAALID